MDTDTPTCTTSPTEPAVRPLFLDLSAVVDQVSLPATTVEQLVCEGAFPPRHLVPGHRCEWLTREVDAWCETQPAELPDVALVVGFEEWRAAPAVG